MPAAVNKNGLALAGFDKAAELMAEYEVNSTKGLLADIDDGTCQVIRRA